MLTTTRIEVRAGCAPASPSVTVAQGAMQARRLRDGGTSVRLALVAAQALLLAGDHVRIEVLVAGTVHVDLIEPAGTVAYDMRGAAARWDVAIELRDGAQLTWDGKPFVVAEGADVRRRTDIVADAGCTASLRETIAFGREGESGGSLQSSARIELADVPLLVEDLDLSLDARAGWATLRGHRCLDSVTSVGHRLPDGVGVLQLAGVGSVHRWIGDELHKTSSRSAGWVGHITPTSGASS